MSYHPVCKRIMVIKYYLHIYSAGTPRLMGCPPHTCSYINYYYAQPDQTATQLSSLFTHDPLFKPTIPPIAWQLAVLQPISNNWFSKQNWVDMVGILKTIIVVTWWSHGVNPIGIIEFRNASPSSSRNNSVCTRPFPSLSLGTRLEETYNSTVSPGALNIWKKGQQSNYQYL
jgi:hypothetical protein